MRAKGEVRTKEVCARGREREEGREGGREGAREREGWRGREGGRGGEKERETGRVCVCVCVCERERLTQIDTEMRRARVGRECSFARGFECVVVCVRT